MSYSRPMFSTSSGGGGGIMGSHGSLGGPPLITFEWL